uniref:Uncharacterized protein n=1 Tax=Arundo donax TaxID=35708 RepID=A0A0A9CQN8_ARUDO
MSWYSALKSFKVQTIFSVPWLPLQLPAYTKC